MKGFIYLREGRVRMQFTVYIYIMVFPHSQHQQIFLSVNIG